jgi:hypothetical protein
MRSIELNLTDEREQEPLGYWKRQFAEEPTYKQRVFDWLFGVIIPTICVAADPIVFRGFEGGLLATYRPFAYILSFISILSMTAFLLWRGFLES